MLRSFRAKLYLLLGRLLGRLRQYQSSLRYLKLSDSILPNSLTVKCWIGWAYQQLENQSEALSAFEQALQVGPSCGYPDNCAVRSNAILDAAGIPAALDARNNPDGFQSPVNPSMPGSATLRAAQLPSDQVQTIQIPKGSSTVLQQLNQFNPSPNQNTNLPKQENNTDKRFKFFIRLTVEFFFK